MGTVPHRISRAADAPGPATLTVHLRGRRDLAKGTSFDIDLDPEADAHQIEDLRHRFKVEPIGQKAPRPDVKKGAFFKKRKAKKSTERPAVATPAVPENKEEKE